MLLTVAIIFLIIALVAYMLGARGLAGFSASLGKTLLTIFLILAVLAVVLGLLGIGGGLSLGLR